MMITIGTTTDDKRKLNKKFSGTNTDVTLKAPCDILHPVFILGYNANLLKCNYLYCPDFGRYYFIDDITVSPGHRLELSCSVDVLMSYAVSIGNIKANVIRNENFTVDYISDDNKVLTTKTQTQTYVFDADPFVRSDGYVSYVLTVIGGKFSGN